MNKFEYFQPNDMYTEGRDTDSEMRALCGVLNKEWLDVLDGLVSIARKIQSIPTSVKVIRLYMEEQGFGQHGYSVSEDYTLANFPTKPDTTYLLYTTGGDFVYCKDNTYFDLKKQGNKRVYSYWSKQDSK